MTTVTIATPTIVVTVKLAPRCPFCGKQHADVRVPRGTPVNLRCRRCKKVVDIVV